jgi:hypothetical protein
VVPIQENKVVAVIRKYCQYFMAVKHIRTLSETKNWPIFKAFWLPRETKMMMANAACICD